ncbi:hypothetical protein EIN_176410 [Entamoeba invadens IP1]|uniref:hypothetical protein n=1 Tax=Entamoeba invadens IP1 TaxID=370355 RepID=UPI0002C3E658|nr:hypothetical protein EIN_176410 [Entamoeba invadens IP1]ELP93824.1 hypothetical protein EIN_176410 [Entamoeba invadens IP1]|eukprot:XP_004260595.1 hypothetical protein EIN_176410 [Entamoeba invadens IP1]
MIRQIFNQLIEKLDSTANLVYKYRFTDTTWKTYMLNSKENIDEFLKSISNETLEPLFITELITEEYDYKKEINEYRNNGAAFFAYHYTEEYKCFSKYLKIAQIFDSLSVENKIRHELNNNCLIYVLQQAKIDEKIIDLYCIHCYSRYQKIKLIDEVSKSCNIRIQIKREELKRQSNANTIMKYIGSDNEKATEISMYLFRDVSMKGISYLTNPGAKSTIKLSELILNIRDNNGFKPYSLSDVLHLKSDLSDYVKQSIELLDYLDFEVKPITMEKINKKSKSKNYTYYYADFEASTQGIHKAYCVAYYKRNSSQISCKYGNECVEDFLSDLDNNSVVYFHNLKYDSCFLAKYGIEICIKKDGKTMKMKLNYHEKKIFLKDSYSMISNKLSDFPKIFDLSNIQKELYPYNYYTIERIQNNFGIISEAVEYESQKWNKEQYNLFKENISKINNCHIKFRNNNLKSLNIDVDNFISISALANHYFKLHVYTQITNLMQYSGKVREFIQGEVYKGRNMCRDNTKQYVTKDLYDYDACSLYPSAIHRLKLATGKPIVIPQETCNKTILNHLMLEQQLEPTNERYISAFIVYIEITKVNKHLHFPIITKKDKKGNHNVNECCTMRVDNIMLEDMIKFQQIEFNIIRIYYWTGCKSSVFSNEIEKIYNLRSQLKKEGNPLQNNYKLLMNNSYGKTIQKPIKNDLVYKYIINKGKCDSDRYLKKNFTLVKSMYDISDNNRCFETNKPFDDFYVPNLIGVQILNTDSVHINKNKMELLEQKYKEIYGKTLRGGELEQFHPDFDELSGNVYS